MIAGDHFDLDAGFLADADGRNHLLARRIDDGLQAQKGQIGGDVVVSYGVGPGRHLPFGKGQHAQSLRGHCVGVPLYLIQVKRRALPLRVHCRGAPLQNDFKAAFDVHQPLGDFRFAGWRVQRRHICHRCW